MAQPEVIKDIEARVKKSGDTMSNILHINTPDSLGIGLEITPVANSGEYGQINLNANLSVSNQNGIAIDNNGGTFRIYGIPSKDGTSKVGYGNTLQFDPYATGNSNVSFLLHSENFRQFLDNIYVDKNGSGATGLWNNGSKYAISVPEFDAIQTNIKTYLDNNNNIHRSGFQGELNLYRFFAAGDEGNYSSSYSLPCVDSHNLTFSINNNSDWIRVLSLDMRSNEIYTIGKFGGNWSNWYKILNNNNFNQYALPISGGTMSGPLNFANGTWNLVGDDCYLGDQNIPGALCIKGNNGNTNLSFFQYGGSNVGKIAWDGSTFIVSHTINGNISGSATRLAYQGNHTEVASNADTSIWVNKNGMLYTSGLWISGTYSDSATPVSYGNIINIAGAGANQLLLQWATDDGTTTGHVYHRDQRDCAGSGDWHPWRMLWQEGDAVTGAVWNDYAECREADTIEPGYVLVETGDDSLTKSTERLSPFAGVSSDTWGFSQGETDKAKTPIAVAGRVLVYPWQDRNNYKPGDCVCAAPEGKVDIMTREEIIQYPDRIVGTVSSVPTYDKWGGGEKADREPVDVNGRIWIKVR